MIRDVKRSWLRLCVAADLKSVGRKPNGRGTVKRNKHKSDSTVEFG